MPKSSSAVPHQRVALLSNGEEAGKGNTLVKETFPLLQGAGLNFVGNIEPKEFYAGKADVAVTDGFTGNVLLKTSEAVASFLISIIREQIKGSPVSAVGGLLAKPAFKRVGALLDPAEYGAAPLLGIDGLVFVGHGRSDARALISAMRVARQAVSGGLLAALRREIRARLSAAESPRRRRDQRKSPLPPGCDHRARSDYRPRIPDPGVLGPSPGGGLGHPPHHPVRSHWAAVSDRG